MYKENKNETSLLLFTHLTSSSSTFSRYVKWVDYLNGYTKTPGNKELIIDDFDDYITKN